MAHWGHARHTAQRARRGVCVACGRVCVCRVQSAQSESSRRVQPCCSCRKVAHRGARTVASAVASSAFFLIKAGVYAAAMMNDEHTWRLAVPTCRGYRCHPRRTCRTPFSRRRPRRPVIGTVPNEPGVRAAREGLGCQHAAPRAATCSTPLLVRWPGRAVGVAGQPWGTRKGLRHRGPTRRGFGRQRQQGARTRL